MDKEREIFRVFGGRLKNGFWKEGIELIWGSDFKQTRGGVMYQVYTLNWIRSRTPYGMITVLTIIIFLLLSNIRGLCIFIYYAHSFDDVNWWCSFKSYIQIHWVMCIISNIGKYSTINPLVSKEDNIFSWFSYWS